jgi:hypothetical protein
MSLLNQDNHVPVQLGITAFAHLGTDDIARLAAVFLSVGYFVMYVIDKKRQWRREDAERLGAKAKSRSKEKVQDEEEAG